MNVSIRTASTSLLAVSLALAVAGCKPLDKASGKAIEGDAATTAPAVSEKEQVSQVIGTQIGQSLKEVGDEIDLDVVFKSIRATIDGKEAPFDEAQSMAIMQAFAERMQARQVAKAAEAAKTNAEEGQKFLAENAKKEGVQTTASGLQYQVLSEGAGAKPKATDRVRVHYRGTLLSGESFDDSYERGEPAEFTLDRVVPGWQEGIQLMPVGSKYKFWIPGALGYGEQGTPGGPIGPNATLVFEVELLDIVDAAQ